MVQQEKEIKLKSVEQAKGTLGKCFVIMPISTPEGYIQGHFDRVYRDIFTPAINNANFEPFRADEEKGTNLIQLEVIKKLIECPMALCDLSTRNPNVLFELGIRQAFDMPVVLVQEINTPRIFDIASIRCLDYRKDRVYDEVIEDQKSITQAINQTFNTWKSGSSINSLVRLLSLGKPAQLKEALEKDNSDPNLQFLISEISALRQEFASVKRDIVRARDNQLEIDLPTKESMMDNQINKEYKVGSEIYNQLRRAVEKGLEDGYIDPDIRREVTMRQRRYYSRYKEFGHPSYASLTSDFETLGKMIREISVTADVEQRKTE